MARIREWHPIPLDLELGAGVELELEAREPFCALEGLWSLAPCHVCNAEGVPVARKLDL